MKRWSAAVANTAFAIFCVMMSVAQASTTYSYVGNNYNAFVGPPFDFDSSMRVSGSFTVDEDLSSLLDRPLTEDLSVASFSFFDGVTTYTKANSAFDVIFATNSMGNITSWNVSSIISGASQFVFFTTDSEDTGLFFHADGTVSNGSISDAPGSWTTSTTPLPAALPLFASGLIGLGYAARRKRRMRLAA